MLSRNTLALVLFAVAPFAFPLAAFAEVAMPPSIKVETGEAQLKAPGEGQPWRTAKPGQVVDFGLVVSTGQDFSGSINYADGTSLVLKPQTMLQVLSDGLRLYRGQAWVKVTKKGKSFTCVMPSAIASVRGTRFSCEVPSYAKTFAHRYVSEFFNRAHVVNGMRGHLTTASMGLALIAGLIEEAPGGKVPSTVKVFEGKVMVVYPAYTGAIKQQWLVTAGEKVDTATGERAPKLALVAADYAHWSLPLPRELATGDAGGLQMLPQVSDDLRELGTRDAVPSRSMRLLDAGHERR